MLMAAQRARERGHEVLTATPKSRSNMRVTPKEHLFFGHIILRNISAKLAYITGHSGCFNYIDTKLFLSKVNEFKPDLIHLHNLHSEYINLPLLFRYIKKHNIPTVWTMHDAWPVTGGCTYNSRIGCTKWKTECFDCPIYRQYPPSLFDNSRKMHRLKKKWFLGVPNLTIIAPSKWLGGGNIMSFMEKYPVRVIYNGINLDVFKPTESKFRQQHGLVDKKIVLGVAFGWGVRKGLDAIITLSKILPHNYQIVLVGTDDNVDKLLPENIISIHRTENQKQLAEIYTAADVFANPTREEVLGLVNVESLACGTPVVTFDAGGSPECIDDSCGIVVPINDVKEMCNAVVHICEDKPFSEEACVMRAKKFDQHIIYDQYVDLYEEVGKRNTSRW